MASTQDHSDVTDFIIKMVSSKRQKVELFILESEYYAYTMLESDYYARRNTITSIVNSLHL